MAAPKKGRGRAGRAKRAGQAGQARQARQARRGRSEDASATRRSRLLLVGALVVSAIVLAAWFPFSSLLNQRSNLANAQNQVAALQKQDTALGQETKNLSDPGEIGRIAREQYQLVNPGQQAYEVLPSSGEAATGSPYAGDPGSTGPAVPSAAPELPPGGVTTTTPPSGHGGSATSNQASGSGFFARMLHSLEFWR